jgi:hypothetical protein
VPKIATKQLQLFFDIDWYTDRQKAQIKPVGVVFSKSLQKGISSQKYIFSNSVSIYLPKRKDCTI